MGKAEKQIPKHSVLTTQCPDQRRAGDPVWLLQPAESPFSSSCAPRSFLKASGIPKTRQDQATESRAQPMAMVGKKKKKKHETPKGERGPSGEVLYNLNTF